MLDGVTDRPVFIDIDGTLTTHPTEQWSDAIMARVEFIKKLVASGQQVVVWSGGGTLYAKKWCNAHGLAGVVTAIGKPEKIIDDNPDIRPKGKMPILTPESYFGA